MRDTADQQTRQFELRARGLNFTADQHITDMERMYIHQNLNVIYGTYVQNLNVPGRFRLPILSLPGSPARTNTWTASEWLSIKSSIVH